MKLSQLTPPIQLSVPTTRHSYSGVCPPLGTRFQVSRFMVLLQCPAHLTGMRIRDCQAAKGSQDQL